MGAVLGAFLLSRLRSRFGQNALLTIAASGFAVTTVVLALVPNFVAVLLALLVGGACWLLSLSTLNASMQLSLPSWVRARGLSVYQLVFMGGQAREITGVGVGRGGHYQHHEPVDQCDLCWSAHCPRCGGRCMPRPATST